MDIQINLINQSNDANNSQIVIFGDDGETPVATHNVRVPPKASVSVTHSGLPADSRLEVSPTGLSGAPPGMPGMKAPLAGCVVIDATSPDSYLDNARVGTPTASPATSVADAVKALKSCSIPNTTGPACIIGHGTRGLITIGGGKSPGTPEQFLSLHNIDVWTPQLAQLKGQIGSLALYGVQVGGGQEGAELLFQIAKVIDAPVYGPTGLIYCTPQGDFYLETGSAWQMATPTQQPQPIAPLAWTMPLEKPVTKA